VIELNQIASAFVLIAAGLLLWAVCVILIAQSCARAADAVAAEINGGGDE